MKLSKKKIISILMSGLLIVGMAMSVTTDVRAEEGHLMTVDLVIFAGQSNMSGAGGNAAAAPAVPHGCGYEFRNGQDPAGLYEVVEPFGARENGYLSDPAELRYGTLASAFMNKYYSATGVPVLGVSMARGGTAVFNYWNKPEVRNEIVTKYDNVIAWCTANHVKVRKQYIVWLQGESDAMAGISEKDYQSMLESIFAPLYSKGLQQMFVITPGNLEGVPGAFDSIITAQKNLCAKNAHYTLASESLHNLPNTYLTDGIHYNQSALNLVGEEAAVAAAAYSKLH